MRNNKILNKSIIFILVLKLVILAFFSSDYQNKLFIPFVDYFLQNFNNPWEHFYQQNFLKAFPSPPLMLYIFSVSYMFFHLTFEGCSIVLQNFFFKLPILFADILILWIFIKLFPNRKKEIGVFYFASPIILYASYMHSQLDLVPTAILFLSIYLLIKNKLVLSSIVFGLALSIKFHVLAALPLMLIYLFRKRMYKYIGYFLIIPPIIYLLFAFPYLFSSGYINMVLKNKEQQLIFDIFYQFKNLKIYITILALYFVYSRFFIYRKINNDLLLSFLGILFSIFVLLIPPMPAWYVWMLPFFSVFFVNHYTKGSQAFYLYIALSITYLVYFIFFHVTGITDLNFLSSSLSYLKIDNDLFRNIAFTLLEGTLIATVYSLYRYGVRSNSIYKQKDRSFLIGVGGDSGAGKSTVLEDIKNLLGKNFVLEIEGDGDHKWERGHDNWREFTHLNPKANFLHRQSEYLLELKKGRIIERVEYDHDKGKFTEPKKTIPNDYIMIGGLHPFYLPKMRKIIDFKIYVDTDEDLRRHWKIIRDINKRGYTREKVLEQIEARMEDAVKYIWPQRNFADIIIRYYAKNLSDIGNPEIIPEVGLKMIVDSNIPLEPLIEKLEEQGVEVYHNYSEDLETQYIMVEQDMPQIDYELIADQIIQNKEEIVKETSIWKDTVKGLVQLVILIMISEKKKEVIELHV